MHRFALLAVLVFTPFLLADDASKKTISPAEASKLAKEGLITVEMEVKSAAISKDKQHWWLNSMADHKDAANFAVYIPKSVVAEFAKMNITDPKTEYSGKTVQVTGYLSMHKGKARMIPQIVLKDTKNIKIVQK